ncbi:MAG: VOC family protein [Betaproteobacteria bacterium]|nr:VOC family protein [Betaproteobacteria bacterium]
MKRKAKAKKVSKKVVKKVAKKKVQAIPKGYSSVTPYLAIQGAAQAIDFYKKVFGALELMRMPGPQGKLGHVEIKVGDSKIMLADESEQMNFRSPRAHGGTPVHIMVYVKDVDATVAKAIESGAKMMREVQDMFYGDRTGAIEDPFGHFWHIATHVRDVSMKEMKRAAEEMAKASGG